ncbi:MAG: GGDEF domain-containing protein [Lachnospiraceae bacterium]|nr:GGDEF domain-containing protein [Lachnospiraceae bacterium]
MKKKIAVCANGWNYDTLFHALKGIKEYASKEDFDVFVFLSFAAYTHQTELVRGELNIYELMDPAEYDGLIVFSTALNSTETALALCKKAKEMSVPVVSVGMEIEGIHSVCVSNAEGMKALVTHLIEEHGVKEAFYIAGTPDHVDSNARLEATREVFLEHGLSFTDEDYKYGHWSNRYTADIVMEVINTRGLPDAFICVNDITAMAACTMLNDLGYDVPGDVIVTGFDNIGEGKIFYPALTTVEQNYSEIGYKACEIIFGEIRHDHGEDSVIRDKVYSSLVCGNSCRCKDRVYEELRIQYCRDSFRRNVYAKLLEQNERVMRQWMADVPSYAAIKDTLCDHYGRNHQFEGEGFYICVNNDYFKDVMSSEKDLLEKGMSADMEPLVALVNGRIVEGLSIDPRTLIPGYDKKEGQQHVYFFMPMHYFDFNYGYVIVTDFPYIFNENVPNPYMEKLQQTIRLMRLNLRLKALYDRDQMTGLYNRFGYENIALPLYEESLKNGTDVMVMFVDINYMKNINDEYGHLYGDNAIRTVVAAITDNIDEKTIAVRFGGDEFLIIAPYHGEESSKKTKDSILEYLKDVNSKKTVPYDISVSIGYVVTDPKGRPDAALQDYIREADRLMYEIKKEMHMKNDRRKS